MKNIEVTVAYTFSFPYFPGAYDTDQPLREERRQWNNNKLVADILEHPSYYKNIKVSKVVTAQFLEQE